MSIFFIFFDIFVIKRRFVLHKALPEAPAMTEFDPKLPYNDLPPLPPPVELIETKEILKQCIAARVALAELKQAAELIPNSAVLVNALPLLEARASSEIENIVTTTDRCRDERGTALPHGVIRGHQDGQAAYADHRYGYTNC
jgi:Fic family protein